MSALEAAEEILAKLTSAEKARLLRWTANDLLRSYPTLRAEDLANAWAYVRSHRDEITRQIEENEAE